VCTEYKQYRGVAQFGGIIADARPADDEARRGWRSGQNFCAAPRHKEILGTARGSLLWAKQDKKPTE